MERPELLDALERGMRRASSQGVLFSQAVAERLGMNSTDLECLGFLLEEGAMTAGALAELTGLTTGAITAVVDRLEKAGYARREKDPNDRRRVIVQPIAEKSEREVVPLFASLAGSVADLCARYTDEQLAVILDYLNRAVAVAQAETAKLRESEGLSAPLGATKSGRLIFASGAARVLIRASSSSTHLYQARFEGTPPTIDLHGGTVTIQYRRFSLDWRGRTGEIELNPTIPWQVELHGGVSKVNADLRDLQIQGIELSGGASDIAVTLPRPSGIVPVRFSGGASKITITRPRGVPARVRVRGGFQKLIFDGKDCDGDSGDARDETRDYATARDRYDFTVDGGASKVIVDVAGRAGPEDSSAPTSHGSDQRNKRRGPRVRVAARVRIRLHDDA